LVNNNVSDLQVGTIAADSVLTASRRFYRFQKIHRAYVRAEIRRPLTASAMLGVYSNHDLLLVAPRDAGRVSG
jgi:hypothetical protein